MQQFVEPFIEPMPAIRIRHLSSPGPFRQRILAPAVTDQATPVSSGIVARTKRIPVEKRVEAAVIAWLRQQTTGYDGMVIPRIKGKRREVRRMFAARSKELLARYRRGEPVLEGCPLNKALAGQANLS